jgi:choline dehydrogenase-like flavoprotein
MFNAREKHTLALIFDTLIPALPAEGDDDPRLFDLKAGDLGVADHYADVVPQVVDGAALRELKWFLAALQSGLLNRLLTGHQRPFSQLSLDERTDLLRRWADSPNPLQRKAFQSVKRLGLALFYVIMPSGQPNPTWPIFDYGEPPGRAENIPRMILPLAITQPVTLYTDALVIGSGAGGGVAAGELSAAGLDVIVVEKGGYYAEADYHGREMESNRQLYERKGVLTSADLGVTLLAGSALGGGTIINWNTSLRPPAYVLDEWHQQYGFTAATSADFQRSLEAVEKRLHVNSDESVANPLNAALERGCRALGYEVSVIPRNVRGCEDCGFCTYGCAFGAKQSTLKTYLQDAFNRGARIIVRAQVERVLHEGGAVSGAEITVQAANGDLIPVTVRARVVVVAAGALHTPALLLRSGLGNLHIGANLHLHPTTVIFSRFDEPVQGWRGAPMTRYSYQFANLDGRGYGVWLETAPVHPGLAAGAFPWHSGRDHKRHMQDLAHFSNIIILTRDYHGGRVTAGRDGQPKIHYRLHEYDGRHLLRGLAEAIRIHCAAGANLIYGPHNHLAGFAAGRNGSLEAFIGQVMAAGTAANQIALYSAHQMSSCRIAGSSALGALSPEGESYEVRGLFVADASVLPSAAGVNPMITIMGLAHYIVQHIRSRLA